MSRMFGSDDDSGNDKEEAVDQVVEDVVKNLSFDLWSRLSDHVKSKVYHFELKQVGVGIEAVEQGDVFNADIRIFLEHGESVGEYEEISTSIIDELFRWCSGSTDFIARKQIVATTLRQMADRVDEWGAGG